jgi:hypothetical protein
MSVLSSQQAVDFQRSLCNVDSKTMQFARVILDKDKIIDARDKVIDARDKLIDAKNKQIFHLQERIVVLENDLRNIRMVLKT